MKRFLLFALIASSNTTIAAETHPQEAVKALEDKFGVHKGLRRNHTKGLCFSAKFVANQSAQKYTSSSIFNGEPINVVGRFSHAGGNIMQKDMDAKVLGMALLFSNGNAEHKMAMLNLPYFAVPTPEAFVKNLTLNISSSEQKETKKERLDEFRLQTPSLGHLQQALAERGQSSHGYENYYYNSIHTFYLIDKDGNKQAARWIFYPNNRVNPDSEEWSEAENFREILESKISRGNVSFDMIVSFPDYSDILNNPTYQWVTTGVRENFGRLSITGLDAQCESVNFDPNQVSSGFESSEDPVLLFRSGAYAVSFAKRLSERAAN